MDWNRFVIYKPEKVIIDNKTEFDILELPSGKYFLNKESFTTKEALTKLKNYTPEELKRDSTYSIYTMVGHTADGKRGITTKITDSKRLNEIIKEIEESLVN